MAKNDSCSTIQTYCALNYETAASLVGRFTYNSCVQAGETAAVDTWNELVEYLKQVYNYGNYGTRNPTDVPGLTASGMTLTNDGHEQTSGVTPQATSSLKSSGNSLLLNDYKSMRASIGGSTINPTLIEDTDINSLPALINVIKFSADRCTNCNVGCNSNCQASSQCHCHCDCYACCQGESYW